MLLGITGRGDTEAYLAETALKIKPSVLIPVHFDDFFRPLEKGIRVMRRAHMGEFYEKADSHVSLFTVKTPPVNEAFAPFSVTSLVLSR
jgi:hypothetical protein